MLVVAYSLLTAFCNALSSVLAAMGMRNSNANDRLQGSISRASIINYLNTMVDDDLLTYTETTGKGGRHRVYYTKHGESNFKQQIANLVITKLLEEYPQETRKALQT